ncbi:hypothetical protein LZ30DRAFT_696072 [Colletotrichum cereale]|nr:hypothetical protein LZ30DRAFT_696072 [Colletotrichum cereale]
MRCHSWFCAGFVLKPLCLSFTSFLKIVCLTTYQVEGFDNRLLHATNTNKRRVQGREGRLQTRLSAQPASR